MRRKWLALSLALGLGALTTATTATAADQEPDHGGSPRGKVRSVEFVGMAAPATPEEKASAYTGAKVKLTYQNGSTKTLDMAYHQLLATSEKVNGKVVGGLVNAKNEPLRDDLGQINSDSPDGQSLMQVAGQKAADPSKNQALSLVTQYEYRGLPPKGAQFTEKDYWSRLPATMSLAQIDQNKKSGALSVTDYHNINFADVHGLWVPCAASLSPWNTHLGSEEYEPDAKVRGGGTKAKDSEDSTDIASFSSFYFGDPAAANPYHYGLVPEVKTQRDGTVQVEKHYALGRIARELVDFQPDQRTAYMGDDGGYTGMYMFIADRPTDLSAGTLYAAKWQQTSPVGADGGSAKLSWIKLGHGTDADIHTLVKGGITFNDIFEVRTEDPKDASFRKVHTYMGTEWLKLKPGKEQAAAFLETRRYAALLGATTEFNKFEGVSHNVADKKAYVVMSRVEAGMADTEGDIKLKANKGGAVYELALTGGVKDTAGEQINSPAVASAISAIPDLLGSYSDTADAIGNKCAQDKVCGGDNIKFSEGMRTLFVGEDTGYRNNNYLWAFNVDTRKLSRVLSVPMGAEATGLQAVDDANGFSYVMSNFQHPGDLSTSKDKDWPQIKELIDKKWNNRLKAAVGYLGTTEGALPAVK